MARLIDHPWLRGSSPAAASLARAARGAEFAAVSAVWRATAGLPIERASALGGSVMASLGPRTRKHRNVLLNLAQALPGAPPRELERVAKGVWRQLGQVLGEYPHLPELVDPANGRVEWASRFDLDEMRASPKGWVFLSLHQANWNLPGCGGALTGFPLDVVYRRMADPALEARIEAYRDHLPCGFIDVAEAARGMMASLRAGRSVGLLIDQRIDEGLMVPLLGRPAPTAVVPARLALKLGVPVVPTRIERLEGVRFRLTFGEPVRTDVLAGVEPREAAVLVMTEVHRQFGRWIVERPEQWVCVKRRWPKAHEPAAARLELQPRARRRR